MVRSASTSWSRTPAQDGLSALALHPIADLPRKHDVADDGQADFRVWVERGRS